MIDRHLIGDVAVAILLAIPTVALARPQADVPASTSIAAPLVETAAIADPLTSDRRFAIAR